MNRAYLVALLLFLFSTPFAQGQKITGKVTDASTGEALVGVNVVYEPNKGTITNQEGKYVIALELAGKYYIEFRYVGYVTERRKIDVPLGGSYTLDIQMKPDFAMLDPVVITAGKFEQRQNEVTVSMEVLKPSAIQNNNSTDFEDAIDRIPGVNVLYGQANIRGTSGFSYGAGSRVLVLVDEMPLLSADAGDVKWSYIPIENVSQIEVIKGASSALFGSSALGGVIHLRSGYPTAKPKTQIQTFFGVYGDPPSPFVSPFTSRPGIQAGISAFHSQQFGKLDFTAGMYSLYDEGYRIGDYSKRIRGNVNLRYRISDRLAVGLNVNAMRDSSGNFFYWQSDTLAFYPATGTNDAQLGIRYNIDPFVVYNAPNGSKHTLRNRYYYTDNQASADRSTQGHVYYNEYQYQQPLELPFFSKTVVSAGGVHLYNGINSGALYGQRDSRNLAFYTQLDQTLWRFSYSLGFRYESFVINRESPINYPVFRSGLNFQAFAATWLRASYGQGFRTPSVAERYANAAAGGIRVIPNPNLESESGWSSEVGIRQGWQLGNFNGILDLAGFWTQFDNMVEFNLGSNGTDIGFQAINLTDRLTRVRGIEISSAMQGKLNQANITMQIGHTYIQPIERFTPVPNLPEFTLDSVLKYRSKHLFRADFEVRFKRVQSGLNFRYNSFIERIDPLFDNIPGVRQYRSQDNAGDWIVDWRIGYAIHSQIDLNLIVRNLFNEAYMIVPGNIGAARHYVVQLTFRNDSKN